MSYDNMELVTTKKVNNESFKNDMYSKRFMHTRRVEFILFNVPTKTGIIANRPYITLLEKITLAHCEQYYRGQYTISKFREDHIKIPEYGYSTKVFIKTVFVTTSKKAPDEKKYFDSLDY